MRCLDSLLPIDLGLYNGYFLSGICVWRQNSKGAYLNGSVRILLFHNLVQSYDGRTWTFDGFGEVIHC